VIKRRYVMGTILTVELEGSGDLSQAMDSLLSVVQGLEERLSRFRPDSEISRLNRSAGRRPVQVSEETFEIVRRALGFSGLTSGAFDPTAQAGQEGRWRTVKLDSEERTLFLPVSGTRLDLGGIGKGYALDRMVRLLEDDPAVQEMTVDFGGQLLFWSREGHFQDQKIAIEDPGLPGAILETFFVNKNCSVSTSSNAERLGHLLDPRSGNPAHGMLSATVVASTATEAEALSTALFVLGEGGLPLLEKFPGTQTHLFAERIGAICR
jgi:thiamine biosynthesis lipoprotein